MAKVKNKKVLSKKEKAVKKKIKTRRKKSFEKISKGKVFIQSSFNNTIMTLTDDNGNTLDWVSAGSLGFKGTKKSTPYTATLIGKAMADKISKRGISDIRVFVSGVGQGRDAATRALISTGVNIATISDITPIPHNGCRPKKPRRV